MVDEGVTVNLSGEGSADTTLTYSWSASPVLTITHADTSTAVASFVAPTITESETYTLTLAATDTNGDTASDTVQVQVLAVNDLPNAIIEVSLTDGSSPTEYPAGGDILLDASASTDADSGIVDYQWSQTAGENVVDGLNLNTNELTVSAPILADTNSLEFSLQVTDAEGGEDTETVTITVLSETETEPSVDAGTDHTVFAGETIILQGQASSTVSTALPLTYLWQSSTIVSEKILLAPDSIGGNTSVSIDDTDSQQTFAFASNVTEAQEVTFTLAVEDQFGNQVEDAILVTVKPLPISSLNDTGVISQADDTQVGDSHIGDYPGQDGHRGNDIISQNGQLEKAGRGDNGFDFTRLDEIGDEVDDTDEDWRCVRDNVTGLIWEVKTADTALHDSSHTYSWYFDDNNGDFDGDSSGAATSCSIGHCNTTNYIAQVNSDGLCGFFDWRMPSHEELLSILHFGQSASPLVDTDYFANTATGTSDPLWYWVREANVDGVDEDSGTAQNAWAIDFATGNDNFLSKSTAAYIRLVRAGR